MTSCDLFVAVAGWEERFLKGTCAGVERYHPKTLLVFVFQEYTELTSGHRETVKDFAVAEHVAYREVIVSREPVNLWKAVNASMTETLRSCSVVLNVSTMPRELIWWSLLRLEHLGSRVTYVYDKPAAYAPDWLTRDTAEPRLVYQLSGLAVLGRPTCLVLLTGFDQDRALQLIEFFEPGLVLLGVQAGTQFNNHFKNVEQLGKLMHRSRHRLIFDLDANSGDRGAHAIEVAISEALAKYNVVASSLGPKVSAVALYQVARKHPELSLAYAPSREFNEHYSSGIGESLEGKM